MRKIRKKTQKSHLKDCLLDFQDFLENLEREDYSEWVIKYNPYTPKGYLMVQQLKTGRVTGKLNFSSVRKLVVYPQSSLDLETIVMELKP